MICMGNLNSMKNFQYYLDLVSTNEIFEVDSNWAQGRSIFGGLSAALILTRIESTNEADNRNLKSLSVNFCGIFAADTPCEIRYDVLSRGKSVVQIQGQLVQNNEVKTQIIACYAAPRESSIHINAKAAVPKSSIDKAMIFPYIPNITPAFIQHIDLGALNNCIPFTGVTTTDVIGWARFKDAPNTFNLAAVIALIDAWPPAVLPMLNKPAPASTITWNMEFSNPELELKPDDAIYYECDVIDASDGYAHTEAKIYDPRGQLIVLSRQLVGVYDKRSS